MKKKSRSNGNVNIDKRKVQHQKPNARLLLINEAYK